jgi:hypothetical protein
MHLLFSLFTTLTAAFKTASITKLLGDVVHEKHKGKILNLAKCCRSNVADPYVAQVANMPRSHAKLTKKQDRKPKSIHGALMFAALP